MDGVLAQFHPEKSIEEISEPGYFRNLEENKNIISAVERLYFEQIDVYILSSVINERAAQEKREWLHEHFPMISDDMMLFVPYGVTKTEYVRDMTGCICTDDVLIDDFTYNLKNWHGIGIKYLNKINNTNRTWTGYVVNGQASTDIIYTTIKGIDLVA